MGEVRVRGSMHVSVSWGRNGPRGEGHKGESYSEVQGCKEMCEDFPNSPVGRE